MKSLRNAYVLVLVVLGVFVSGVNSGCSQCTGVCKNDNIDLVFVIDGSGSICRNQPVWNCAAWTSVKTFLSRTVEYMDVRSTGGDRVGFVQFGNEATKEFGLDTYTSYNTLSNAILSINIKDENTNTSGGLKVARTEVFNTAADRSAVKNVVLVITDGKSTRDASRTLPEARLLEASGAQVFTVGVTSEVAPGEVQGISSAPQRENVTYWLLPDFTVFDSFRILNTVFDTFCRTSADFTTTPSSVPTCPGTETPSGCYVLRETPSTWSTAESDCRTLGNNMGRPGFGHLASILDTTHYNLLVNAHKQLVASKQTFAAQEQLDKMWLGGYEESVRFGGKKNPRWRWVADDSLVKYQGCFEDSQASPEFTVSSAMSLMTPTKCIEKCYQGGFAVAALKAGTTCSCGTTWGRYKATEGCSTYCPGDTTQRCGGTNLNAIYLTSGAYVKWHYDQPNNYNEYQPCGKLNLDGQTKEWAMTDTLCYERLNYICQMPDTLCTNPPVNHYKVNNRCIYIENVQVGSWFEARLGCKARLGELLTLDSEATLTALSKQLTDLYSSAPYWIGLVGRKWMWIDGQEFIYSKWHNSEPNAIATNCLLLELNKQDVYGWNEGSCDDTLPYVCYIDFAQALTTTTEELPVGNATTPVFEIVTNETSTTTESTTVTPDEATPDIGASTNNEGGLSTVWIVIIVIIALLILIIIIGLIVWCCIKKKDEKIATVAPSHTNDLYVPAYYEERPDEPVYRNYQTVKIREEEKPVKKSVVYEDNASSSDTYEVPVAQPGNPDTYRKVKSRLKAWSNAIQISSVRSKSRYDTDGMYNIRTRITGNTYSNDTTVPDDKLTILRNEDLQEYRNKYIEEVEKDEKKKQKREKKKMDRSNNSETDEEYLARRAKRRAEREERRKSQGYNNSVAEHHQGDKVIIPTVDKVIAGGRGRSGSSSVEVKPSDTRSSAVTDFAGVSYSVHLDRLDSATAQSKSGEVTRETVKEGSKKSQKKSKGSSKMGPVSYTVRVGNDAHESMA